MPRGGFRPGSGPKKGTKYKTKKRIEEEMQQEAKEKAPPPLPKEPILPLDYMLAVLNDPAAHVDRRDRMAALAAPFCHGRIAIKTPGKKDEKQEKAKESSNRFGQSKPPVLVRKNG